MDEHRDARERRLSRRMLRGQRQQGSSGSGASSSGGGGSAGPYASSSGTSPAKPLLVHVDTGGTLVTTPGNGIGVYSSTRPAATGASRGRATPSDEPLVQLHRRCIRQRRHDRGPRGRRARGQRLPRSTRPSAARGRDHHDHRRRRGCLRHDPWRVDHRDRALNAPVSFFFVQDNLVNGGYKGALTNPLIFQPSSP